MTRTNLSKTLTSDNRVLSINEAATLAGVSPATLKRRGAAGELKITKLSPRRIGVRSDHLQAWLDSCTG